MQHASSHRPPVVLTTHAAVRLQQRGIPAWFLALLVEHGKACHDGHGAVVCSVDKGARRRMQQALSRTEYAEAERYFGVYAVVSGDDAVITAARRRGRRFH